MAQEPSRRNTSKITSVEDVEEMGVAWFGRTFWSHPSIAYRQAEYQILNAFPEIVNNDLNETNAWIWREIFRHFHGAPDLSIQWAFNSFLYIGENQTPVGFPLDRCLLRYFVYQSESDPTRIAYTPTDEYGRRDRQVVTTVGKFLAKHYGDLLTADQIRDFATRHSQDYGSQDIYFALTAEEIKEVYTEGPNSCMSHAFDSQLHHPTAVYAGPDTAVAYIKRGNAITARAVVMVPEEADMLSYGRVYGDETRLVARLQKLGFTYEENGIEACRLARLKAFDNRDDRLVLPYIDYTSTPLRDTGEYLVFDEDDGDFDPQTTQGYATHRSQSECNDCGEQVDDDEITETFHEEYVCQCCLDNHYHWAVVSHSYRHAWVYEDHCTYIEDLGEAVLDDLDFERIGLVYVSSEDEWYQRDNCHHSDYEDEWIPRHRDSYLIVRPNGDEDWVSNNTSVCALYDGRLAIEDECHKWSDGEWHFEDDEEPGHAHNENQLEIEYETAA